MKTKRKWVARVRTPRIEMHDLGLGPLPGTRTIGIDHPIKPTEERMSDSTHLIRCPKCGQVRYVDRRFVESVEEIKRRAEGTNVIVVGARHKQCETVLEISEL